MTWTQLYRSLEHLRRRVLYTLSDTFIVNLSSDEPLFSVIMEPLPRFLKMITPVRCVIPPYDSYIIQPKGVLYWRYYPTVKSVPKYGVSILTIREVLVFDYSGM